MYHHHLRVYPSRGSLPKESQLAWQLARIAADPVPVDPAVAAMIVNRFIDNASVAIAAINRRPVANARSQALAHARAGGATVFGLPNDRWFAAEWAAWANATAVRELDMHDTYLAADYAHPAGARPFERPQYIRKFDTLAGGLIEASERDRFVNLIQGLPELKSEKVRQINVQLPSERLENFEKDRRGIF